MSISELKKLPIEIDRVVLPLETHYTTPGDLLYEPKTQVSIGQALTKFSSTSITLHSPINGIINNINNYPTLQSLGQLNSNLKIPSIEITKFDQDHNSIDKNNKNNKPHTDFLNTLNKYGIVGLGGAGFPTSNKLNSLINMIIVNCMECESPITSDNGLIINYSKNIISGLIILNNILKPKKIIIAIKKDMQLAITNLQEALSQFNFSNASNTSNNISIEIFDSNYGYPNGYSKSLIKLVTKQKIASHAHSSDHGIVCLNVATVYAIEQAINFNTPLIERVVTITGDLINNPGNYLLPIGTPIGTILNAFSVKYLNNLDINLNIKIGGDYMGYELFNSNNPIHLENRDYLN
ncbi:MAG: hypothetical protein KBD64_08210 [Gammaproteobacteria bacterium]|nr:hypothetical protein [Gammaproteobacteria bacterium]